MVALSFPCVAPSLSFPPVAPSLTLGWPYLTPMLALSDPYVGPILAQCHPIVSTKSFCPFWGTPWTLSLTLGWPYLAPMLALSCPYVAPILAQCHPIVSTHLPKLAQNRFDLSFFPFRGTPWTPKPRKTRGFLRAPGWNPGTPRGPKHRKTRCFWTPRAEYTVNYKGSGEPEVSPRSPPWGRRRGGSPL